MVTLLTPTRNRLEAFTLLQRWVSAQTFSGSMQWIVVNDGREDYNYSMGQEVVQRKVLPGDRDSLHENLLAGLPLVRGNKLLIVEDDDYLAPDYVQTHVNWLDSAELVGSVPAIYYNLASRFTRHVTNTRHASLGQTGLRVSLVPWFESILRSSHGSIDLRMWRQFGGKTVLFPNKDHRGRPLHVSMKNMPGEPGLGIGHRLRRGHFDCDGEVLQDLLGRSSADAYATFARPLSTEGKSRDPA